MRIRTIKPEFWSDSTIVQLPIEARLLFIGLWNVADDHGWIQDDAAHIHMLVFPSEASIDVPMLLDMLIACGRIERHIQGEDFRLLRVANWERHQKVDRPSPSRILANRREPSRKLAISLQCRREVASKYGCQPGGESNASCYYCGEPGLIKWHKLHSGRPSSWVSFSGLELDHVVAEANGGKGVASNIVLACRACNRSKGAEDFHEFSSEKLSEFANPREPSRIIALEQGTGSMEQGTGKVMNSDFSDSVPKVSPSEKKPKPNPPTPQLPFASDAFAAAWAGFLEMRVKKKAKPTDKAIELIFADLIAWGEADAITALQNSIKNNWTGIFMPAIKAGEKPKPAPTYTPTLKFDTDEQPSPAPAQPRR